MTMDSKRNSQKHGRLRSEKEAIDFLGLQDRPNPKGALAWMRRTGKLAYVKLGRGIYGFTDDDLQACIENCRVSPDN